MKYFIFYLPFILFGCALTDSSSENSNRPPYNSLQQIALKFSEPYSVPEDMNFKQIIEEFKKQLPAEIVAQGDEEVVKLFVEWNPQIKNWQLFKENTLLFFSRPLSPYLADWTFKDLEAEANALTFWRSLSH